VTPSEYPDLYRSIVLGLSKSPGVVTLSGHRRDQAWDVVAAKGQVGASSKLNGAGVGQFQASFYLATKEQQDAWPPFQRVIESLTDGPKPVAKSIYHPDLALNHYTEVSNASIGELIRDDRGGATVLAKFIEYLPPKPKAAKGATGAGGTAVPGGGGSPGTESEYDPNAERKRELDALLDEADKV